MPFGLKLRIELDQTVPDRVDGALAVEEIAVERRQISEVALAEDATPPRLLGHGLACLLRAPRRASRQARECLRA